MINWKVSKRVAKIKAKNEYVQNLILRYFSVLRKYCRQQVKNATYVTEEKVLNGMYFCQIFTKKRTFLRNFCEKGDVKT